MIRRIAFIIFVIVVIMGIPVLSHAKLPSKIAAAISSNYPAAQPHRGLETAYDEPDPAKFRGFVVMERGGIPAERARFFISWDEYDYRGAVADLTKGKEITTRRGAPYTYLQRGDVLAVADVSDFAGTVYFKLITYDVYVPENRQKDKRHSRVTVMLGFKLPKDVVANDDADGVIKLIGQWIKPFSNIEDAKSYSASLKMGGHVQEPENVNTKGAGAGGSARLKSLEEKIEAAKRDMEEAEKEMKRLRDNSSNGK